MEDHPERKSLVWILAGLPCVKIFSFAICRTTTFGAERLSVSYELGVLVVRDYKWGLWLELGLG